MARGTGVGSIVKSATNVIAQVPGGERMVLQAVKDLLDELRDLRRKNASLEKEVDRLKTRLERLQETRARQRAR